MLWKTGRRVAAEGNPGSEGTVNSATPSTVRDVNRSIILNLVRRYQPISRVDLSKRTGIFRSSISAIVDELLGDGLIVEERAKPKGRGRVPVNLSLNPNGFRVLGVSIRSFQTRVVASGLTASLDGTISFPTPAQPASLVKEVAGAIKSLCGDGVKEFQEVGISVPGMVNSDTGEILMIPSLPDFTGVSIASEISALAGAPASADNDSNLGALAELWLNEAEVAGVRDFVFVEVGRVGVGTALILNGELYGGHDHTWVGEFGHMIIDPSGPACHCGRRGCWERYVCDQATWHRFDPSTEFTRPRFDHLIQLAKNGDTRAVRAFRITAEYLSLGLSNMMLGLNPQRIVLAGEITGVWGLIQQTVEGAYSAGRVRPRVYPARYGLDVLSLQGAVVLALRKLFASPKLG